MLSVWKYEILVENRFMVRMPVEAKVIHVDVQNDIPYMWAAVDPEADEEERLFHVAGTGHPIPSGLEHLGSFMLADGRFVGHLFQKSRLNDISHP